jgi:hypothetical protein
MVGSPFLIDGDNREVARYSLHRLLQLEDPCRQLVGERRGEGRGSAHEAMRGYVDRVARVSLNTGEVVDDRVAVSKLIECLDAQVMRESLHTMLPGPEPRGTEIER